MSVPLLCVNQNFRYLDGEKKQIQTVLDFLRKIQSALLKQTFKILDIQPKC